MKKITQKEFDKVVEQHKLWLNNKGGEIADFSGCNLSGIKFGFANLKYANLSDTNLRDVNLRDINLSFANLSDAILIDAILIDTNLSFANLRGANLRGADLRGTIGNSEETKSLFVSEEYPIVYTDKYLQIGCERHLINDWWRFNDDCIDAMDEGALEWWKEWKDFIRSAIELSPAKPAN